MIHIFSMLKIGANTLFLVPFYLITFSFTGLTSEASAEGLCGELVEKSQEFLECQANNGNKDAQYQLGEMAYKVGNIPLAKNWLNKAAKHIDAQDGKPEIRGKVEALILLSEINRNGRKLIKENIGPKITNYKIEGSLTSHHDIGCKKIETLSNKITPADLFKGIPACLQKERFSDAADMFMLARLFGSFDHRRITDRTAGQGITVMQMNTFNTTPPDKTATLQKLLKNKYQKGQSELNAFCDKARDLGYPVYYPEYMILHGINAFGRTEGDGLIKDFNAQETWEILLSKHCPPKK